MRIYLKALYRATIRMFHTGDPEEVERLEAENGAALARVYDGIADGRYDYAYVRQGHMVRLYTRDMAADGRVRKTHFIRMDNGELLPTTHHVFRDAAEMAKDAYPHGVYVNIHTIRTG